MNITFIPNPLEATDLLTVEPEYSRSGCCIGTGMQRECVAWLEIVGDEAPAAEIDDLITEYRLAAEDAECGDERAEARKLLINGQLQAAFHEAARLGLN